MAQSFRELLVWQKSIELAKEVYVATGKLPKTEQYGLASQMRRCVVSIASNIAEGSRRGSKKDFTHFLRIADGSVAELETQMVIAAEAYRLPSWNRSEELLSEVRRMLSGLVRSLA